MNMSLSLEALRYGHRQPLFAPLTIQCQPGEIWAVLGANGRGKSTLLDTLTGVLPPLGGQVNVEGGIAIVPQSFRPAVQLAGTRCGTDGPRPPCRSVRPAGARR